MCWTTSSSKATATAWNGFGPCLLRRPAISKFLCSHVGRATILTGKPSFLRGAASIQILMVGSCVPSISGGHSAEDEASAGTSLPIRGSENCRETIMKLLVAFSRMLATPKPPSGPKTGRLQRCFPEMCPRSSAICPRCYTPAKYFSCASHRIGTLPLSESSVRWPLRELKSNSIACGFRNARGNIFLT